MQTCGVQIKWTCSSTESTGFWSIDNIAIDSNSSLFSVNRREVNDYKLQNSNAHKRQAAASCNSYNDDFDSGIVNSTVWDLVYGSNVQTLYCQVSSNWLFFRFRYPSRSATTQSLNLQGLTSLTFYLIFGSTGNGCHEPSSNEGIFVDYRIYSNGTWNITIQTVVLLRLSKT